MIIFAFDKYCAIKDKNRVPERNLYLFSLIGGWFGGWVSMYLFRHKTNKTAFLIRFYTIGLGWFVGLFGLINWSETGLQFSHFFN